MADSAAFICPQCLLAFPCLAGIARTLQSSARGVLGIQAFSSLGRGRNGVVKPAGSIISREKSRTEQASCSTHPRAEHTANITCGGCLCHAKDGGCSRGSNPTWRAPQPPSTPHKSLSGWENRTWSRVWGKAWKHILSDIPSSTSPGKKSVPCGVTCPH